MKIACPRCGANVTFMPSTQKCYCDYCGCESDISEFNIREFEESVNQNEENGAKYDEYTCSTCGAKLLMDEETTITDCVYCGSRQIVKEKFKGIFRPEAVLPFKIDKNKFISMYKSFIRKKILAPKEFKNNSKIYDIKGLYVPFYVYTFLTHTYARGMAIYRSRDSVSYKYFEAEYSMKVRSPQDASKNFNDDIMTSLEPFKFEELQKFTPVYLSGFVSENGNENLDDLEKKAEERGLQEIKNTLNKKLDQYKFESGKLYANFKKEDRKYVLLPVWFFNTNYKGKQYAYALNGQTGKIVGEIPLSKPKFWAVMGVLIFLAAAFSIMLLSADIDSDSSDGLGEVLALVWGGVVAAYVAIKARYKNVKKVLQNSIERFDIDEKTFNTYSKGKYVDKFGEDFRKKDIKITRE